MRAGSAVAALLLLLGQTYAYRNPLLEFGLDSRHLDEKILEAVEHGQSVMRTGFPELGVPPLDPLRVPRISATLQEISLRLDFEARGVNITNLAAFEVDSLRTTIGPDTTTVEFTVAVPLIVITADSYRLKGEIMIVVPIKEAGKMQLVMRDVLVTGHVTLQNDALTPTVDDLVIERLSVPSLQAEMTGTSPLGNHMLSEHGGRLINSSIGQISAAIRRLFLPLINTYIAAARLSTVADSFYDE